MAVGLTVAAAGFVRAGRQQSGPHSPLCGRGRLLVDFAQKVFAQGQHWEDSESWVFAERRTEDCADHYGEVRCHKINS
jgi:hypothetical protein